jgi:hypothetical protein
MSLNPDDNDWVAFEISEREILEGILDDLYESLGPSLRYLAKDD